MGKESKSSIADLAGKFLTFELGKEVYGLEILKVQEIIGMMSVTKVPRTPNFIRGVVNLRGKVIPVVDLRLKFGLEFAEDTDKTCIIVVQVSRAEQKVTMGIIVDEVSEVLSVVEDQLEKAPELGAGADTDFIMAIGKIDTKVVMLLDVDAVLSSGEIDIVGSVSKA